MTTLTYRQARAVVVGFGTALISGVGVAAFLRGADPVEVTAIILFLPVLVGLALWDVRGGLVLGLVVSAIYLAVRFSTLGGLPKSEFVNLGIVRVLLYLGLGVLGGWANATLSQSLRKLELYDEIDDTTGVGNARALLALSDREVARADRYASMFSLVVVRVARSMLPAGRRTASALRRLCQTLETSVRATDLVARVPRKDHEELVVVLPETTRTGAELLGRRLVAGARQLLAQQGFDTADGHVSGTILTYPTDDDAIARYRAGVADALRQETLAVEDTV